MTVAGPAAEARSRGRCGPVSHPVRHAAADGVDQKRLHAFDGRFVQLFVGQAMSIGGKPLRQRPLVPSDMGVGGWFQPWQSAKQGKKHQRQGTTIGNLFLGISL
jgi:hypothetical protein